MQKIMDLSAEGKSSREIGEMFGKSGSYIRHLRVKIRNERTTNSKTSQPYIDEWIFCVSPTKDNLEFH